VLKANLLFLSLGFMTVAALAATPSDPEVLALAHRQQLEFRQGNLEVAKPLVTMLEEAVARSPDNAQLWEALGHASMSLQGSMFTGPIDPAKLVEVGERARNAYARSLALKPNNPLVRSSHGMATTVVSLLKNDGPGIAAGVDEMNAAVHASPKYIGVRLTRAFTIVHLPPGMRDNDAVTEDLRFLIDSAPGGRPEDVIHVLLGDVLAETGNLKGARSEYEQVSGASAFAAEQVKLRFADLETGAIRPESIVTVRAVTGSGCVACHAPGTDN
jgi:cytochrome c-type biogenesis protein CcmH/NrfG